MDINESWLAYYSFIIHFMLEASMIVLRSENIFIVTPKVGLIQDSIILIFKVWRELGIETFFWHTVHTGHLRIRIKLGFV